MLAKLSVTVNPAATITVIRNTMLQCRMNELSEFVTIIVDGDSGWFVSYHYQPKTTHFHGGSTLEASRCLLFLLDLGCL